MKQNVNEYQQYTSEISYIYDAKMGDTLLPDGVTAVALEITSLGFPILIETNVGTRAIPENSSTTFSNTTKDISYAKVLKGNSKICVTAGVIDYTPEQSVAFALSKWGV